MSTEPMTPERFRAAAAAIRAQHRDCSTERGACPWPNFTEREADELCAALSAPVEAGATEPAPGPCQCLRSHAYISPTHRGHCCFLPAGATCHPTEVREWQQRHAQLAEAGAPAEPDPSCGRLVYAHDPTSPSGWAEPFRCGMKRDHRGECSPPEDAPLAGSGPSQPTPTEGDPDA